MNPSSGIVYYDPDTSNGRRTVHLPLEEVKVKVLIIDVSASVTLTQTYNNPSDSTTTRCKYCFPVPANAAICAFSMETSDGRIITGIAKEKDKAREEYEQALGAGRTAGLLNYVTDDIFTISIGAIPRHAEVTTKLVYVMSLANDDNTDEVRFQLPMCVGERYGTPPTELASAHGVSPHTRIRFTAQIQTSGIIHDIISPSHQADISKVPYLTRHGRASRRRSTINYKSRSYLDRDFILVIQAEGLDEPRCFAEIAHDPDRRGSGTIAMQLSVVPKFDLPPISAQEYLFVIDRSGSMSGARVSTAKETLTTLLRMIPNGGSIFNIFSFGSIVNGLWPRSKTYDQTSLDTATSHVDSMNADYGGTEIRQALLHVLNSRTSSMPTAVFVLTDGDAHDLQGTLTVVEIAVNSASQHGPLRVFTLGIGDGISSAMCEGIARVGRGACFYAVNASSIFGKCARLFRAGRTPFVQRVEINWGISDEYLSSAVSSVNFSIPTTPPNSVRIRQLPIIQQAPTKIQDIHASTRTNVFAILTLKKLKVPESITLRGELDGGGGNFELEIPINTVQLAGAKQGLPLVHTLAAWRLIQEHEDQRAPLPQPVTPASDDQIRKAVIVHLGEKYQLASQHTSFVAIDSGQDDRRYPNHAGSTRATSPIQGSSRASDASDVDLPLQSRSQPEPNGLGSMIFNFFASFFQPAIHEGRGQTVPGAWTESPPPSPPASDNGGGDGDDGYSSAGTFTTLSSLEESTEWSDWSAAPRPQLTEEEAQMQRSPSPQLEPRRLAPDHQRAQYPAGDILPVPPPPPPPVEREVMDLIRLQLFDGSFSLDSLRGIVGSNAVDEATSLQVDSAVWATALSVAFIEKRMKMKGLKELRDDLLIKAQEFLRGSIPDLDSVEGLMRRARQLVQ